MAKTKRTLNCITWIQATPDTIAEIAGKNEISYSELLKKLWVFWKANKLYRIETLTKK